MIDYVIVISENISDNKWKLWFYEYMYIIKYVKKVILDYIKYL